MYDRAMPSRSLQPRSLRASSLVLLALMLSLAICALGVDQAQGAPSAEAVPGEVQTEPAEATPNGFKLRGRLNPAGSSTTYYFRYKDTATECEDQFGCGPTTPVDGPLTGDIQQEVPPIEVTGLDPGQTYRYWLIASNAHGAMARGRELTFTTPAGGGPSEVQTEPAEATSNGFKLKGRLNPENLPTTYYFVYKDTGLECEDELGCGPTTSVGGPLTGDTQEEVPPIEVTGLDPGQTYHYWLNAINARGIARGRELTFVAGTPAPNTNQTNVKLEAVISLVSPLGAAAPPTANTHPVPSSPGATTKPTAAKAAQKLSKAMKACGKEPKSKRAACEKQARKKYGVAARKK